MSFVAVFIGGGIGSLLRYIISKVLNELYPVFPVGTLFVNLLGSFLIGLLSVILSEMIPQDLSKKLFLREGLLIGLLGGLTTFSTFSYESIQLLQDARFYSLAVYILSNVVLGLVLVWLGHSSVF